MAIFILNTEKFKSQSVYCFLILKFYCLNQLLLIVDRNVYLTLYEGTNLPGSFMDGINACFPFCNLSLRGVVDYFKKTHNK